MTAPGELRHRLVLEAPVETPDGAGGMTRSFAARTDTDADDLAGTVTHRIVIRTRSDLTTHHRFRLGARIYRIVGLRDEDGSGRFIEVSAEERVN
jgi:head-tail adaptor